jgi:hypothetical protein
MRARYNHYGSIEIDESRETDVLFDVLNRRAVERAVGEQQRFEMAVTRGMPREEWLSALWLGRVQIDTPRGRAEVAQTMVREDVWLYLAENSGFIPGAPPPSWRFIDSAMRLETAFDTDVIRDPALEGTLRELYSVTHGLKRLGRPWAPGTCCGPQDGPLEFHAAFARAVVGIAEREIARSSREAQSPPDDPDDE